jgi:hypothetical protein
VNLDGLDNNDWAAVVKGIPFKRFGLPTFVPSPFVFQGEG